MIDRDHKLSITRQAKLLGISSSERFRLEGFVLWLCILDGILSLFLFTQFDGSWGAIQILVGGIFVGVATGILFDRVDNHRSVLNSRNIILMGVLLWILLDPLQMQEGIEEFSPDVVLQTLLYIMVFTGAVLAGYSLPPYRGVHRFFWRIKDAQGGTALFWTLLIIWLISIVPIVVVSESIMHFWWLLLAGYSSPGELGWRRETLGDEHAFLISLAGLLQLSVPFLGSCILREERFHLWQKWLAGIMVATVLIIVFFSGSRRIFAFIVLGPLFYLYLSLHPRLQRRWAIVFVTVPVILLWLMQAQVQFRAIGFYEFDPSIVEVNPLRLHRDNNFYWLAMAVDTMPKTYDYTGEWVFLQLLIHPVPRFLWPEKPFTTGLPFMSWEEAGSTLSLSVVGDLYVGHGILGIILGGLIYGWAARNWDQLRAFATGSDLLTMIYCLGLSLLLLGIRSFWDIASNWYVLGIIVLTAFYFSKLTKRKRPVALLEER